MQGDPPTHEASAAGRAGNAGASDASATQNTPFVWSGAMLAGVLNHLLSQHPNAIRRLKAHSGRIVFCGVCDAQGAAISGLGARFSIADDGRVVASASESADAQVLIRFRGATVRALLSGDRQAIVKDLRLEGDPLLAGLVAEILGDLRWDSEDDLAAVIGDIPARRFHAGLESVRENMADTGSRAKHQFERVAMQWLGAGSMLVQRDELLRLSTHLSELDTRLDQLTKRLDN